jgi:uncharacterized membrane protein
VSPWEQRLSRSYLSAKVVLSIAAVAVCATNIWIIKGGGGPFPWLGAIGGFLLAIALPAWMLSQKIHWPTNQPSDRLGYGVMSAILGVMVIGLTMNTVLPHLGVSRPLDKDPVLIAADVWCLAIVLWRRRCFDPTIGPVRFGRLCALDWTVGLLAALCVPMAVVGANRLNNGASGNVTLVMLILAAALFVVMFTRRHALNSGTLPAAIYFISLAMLLMTSLRGWYTTGHDIQVEYKVFELTKTHAVWNISSYQDAYNACLSITIMPTYLWQLMRVDDPYIYKLWYQLLFALCPVFVYRIALLHTNKALAIITAIYFLSFPTYFTDMPFLNRQEIAFLFVGVCIMLATGPAASHRKVRVAIGVFSVGVVFSHYSTAYVFLGTLAVGWAGYGVWRALNQFRIGRQHANGIGDSDSAPSNISRAISLANVVLVLVSIILWNGVATHTTGNLISTVSQVADSIRGGTGDTRSGDVSYSLFATNAPTQSEVLSSYAATARAQATAPSTAGAYYPQNEVQRYAAPLVTLPNLPITPLGQVIDKTGLSVSALNSAMRSGAAKLLQIFVAVGLLGAVILRRRRRSRNSGELISLGCAALVITALQVVLPVISVDYGVLRAFLQAMIVFGPFISIGSVLIFRPLGERWGLRLAFATATVFFLSLTGVLPQLLGGYPAQLNLNNSGQYYDIYYPHPQEVSAIQWLGDLAASKGGGNIQSQVETDWYTFSKLQTFTGLIPVSDIYPPLIRRKAYVFLGYPTVTQDQATISDEGDIITYKYPLAFLNSTKNLIYSNKGAMIYG